MSIVDVDREACMLVFEELQRARALHTVDIVSSHEAFAVVLEELDEFKGEVWKKAAQRDRDKMFHELIQCAAMCVRSIVDLRLFEDEAESAAQSFRTKG